MKYAGKTVVTLAREREGYGNITKRNTAWKYLISHIRTNITPLEKRGDKYHKYDATDKARYLRDTWVARIIENGDALCHAHGYQLRTEVAGELQLDHIWHKEAMIKLIAEAGEHTYSLSTLPREPQDWNDSDYYLNIAGRTIILHRSDSASWDKGSHWPSSTSISRFAHLLREGWDDLSKPALLRSSVIIESDDHYGSDIDRVYCHGLRGLAERSISYEARGNWLLKIIADLLNITPERQRGLSHIQLDPHYRIALTRKIVGVEIWRRTLAGEIGDYCAVQGKDTYHAPTPREAIRGLARKIATPGTHREAINMDYALSLGYCRSGIEQFCDDYGLDAEQTYSRGEIQALIVAGNGRAEKYHRELAKAGFIREAANV